MTYYSLLLSFNSFLFLFLSFFLIVLLFPLSSFLSSISLSTSFPIFYYIPFSLSFFVTSSVLFSPSSLFFVTFFSSPCSLFLMFPLFLSLIVFILSSPSLAFFPPSFSLSLSTLLCVFLFHCYVITSPSSPPSCHYIFFLLLPAYLHFFIAFSPSLPLAVSSPPSPTSTVGARQQHNKMAGLAQPKSESKLPLEIRTKSVEHTLVPLVAQVSNYNKHHDQVIVH